MTHVTDHMTHHMAHLIMTHHVSYHVTHHVTHYKSAPGKIQNCATASSTFNFHWFTDVDCSVFAAIGRNSRSPRRR